MELLWIAKRQQPSSELPPGPPYASTTAGLGGVPNNSVDTPITSVFMALFIIGAISNMTILQLNLRRGHKFLFSGMLFGFCTTRTVTCIMRIVWANRQTNVNIAIAATIFVAAGVVLLFAINTAFAQRVLRAMHPRAGWNSVLNVVFICLYVLIVISLIILVTATVGSFFTLDANTKRIYRDLQLYGQTYYVFLSVLPIPIIVISLLVPQSGRTDKFGSGRHRNKLWILLFSSALLCLGAAFRTGTNYKTPRPRDDPAWYHSKACFYIFNFTIEIIVVYAYLLFRVDKRFHVPNGAKGPGAYSRGLLALKLSPPNSGTSLPAPVIFGNEEIPLALISQAHTRDYDLERGRTADTRDYNLQRGRTVDTDYRLHRGTTVDTDYNLQMGAIVDTDYRLHRGTTMDTDYDLQRGTTVDNRASFEGQARLSLPPDQQLHPRTFR